MLNRSKKSKFHNLFLRTRSYNTTMSIISWRQPWREKMAQYFLLDFLLFLFFFFKPPTSVTLFFPVSITQVRKYRFRLECHTSNDPYQASGLQSLQHYCIFLTILHSYYSKISPFTWISSTWKLTSTVSSSFENNYQLHFKILELL